MLKLKTHTYRHHRRRSSINQQGYSSAEESGNEYEVTSPHRSSIGQLHRRQSYDYGGHRSEHEVLGGNMFELFRTYDGEEYTVYVREDGKRFYVDFEEQVG